MNPQKISFLIILDYIINKTLSLQYHEDIQEFLNSFKYIGVLSTSNDTDIDTRNFIYDTIINLINDYCLEKGIDVFLPSSFNIDIKYILNDTTTIDCIKYLPVEVIIKQSPISFYTGTLTDLSVKAPEA